MWFREDDVHIGQRMAIEKYEPYLTRLFLRYLKPGMRVIDVGANIGHYTLAAAKAVGKKGKVWAFEPESNNFFILLKNLEENMLKNVEAVKAAVGRKVGIMKLLKSKENFGDHRIIPNSQDGQSSQRTKQPHRDRHGLQPRDDGSLVKAMVKMVNLDQHIGDQKIDLIKIDVQGWEPEVIEGARGIIAKWKPAMILEFCPTMMKEAGVDAKSMWKYLEGEYASIWTVDEYLFTYQKVNYGQATALANNPTASVNLIMLSNTDVHFWLNRFKDIRWKKVIKKMWDNGL